MLRRKQFSKLIFIILLSLFASLFAKASNAIEYIVDPGESSYNIYEETDRASTHYYKITFTPTESQKYVTLEADSMDDSVIPYIYMSSSKDSPSILEYDVLSIEKNTKNVIHFPLSVLNRKAIGQYSFYFSVKSSQEANLFAPNINIYFRSEIQLKKNERFVFVSIQNFRDFKVAVMTKDESKEDNYFSFYITGAEGQDIKVNSITFEGKDIKSEVTTGEIYNGQAYIVGLRTPTTKEEEKYIFDISTNDNSYVTFGVREKGDLAEFKPNSPAFYGILNHKYKKQQCFTIPDKPNNAKYLVNIYSKSESLLYELKKTVEEDLEHPIQVIEQLSIVVSDDKRTDYPYICVRLDNDDATATFSLQILKYSDYVADIDFEPIPNGIKPTILLDGGIIQYYRHLKHSKETKDTSFNVIRESGDIEVYIYHCKTFPTCGITKEEIPKMIENKTLTNVTDIVQTFTYLVKGESETNLLDDEQYLLVVNCLEETKTTGGIDSCRFDVTFLDEKDVLQISENQMLFQPMYTQSEDKYSIDLAGPVTSFEASLFTLTGDSYLNITYTGEGEPEYITSNYGNTEMIVLNFKDKAANGKIEMNVIGTQPNFYGIQLRTKNLFVDGRKIFPGFVTTQSFSKDDLSEDKKLAITFSNILKGTSYVTTIQSINCDLTIEFQGGQQPEQIKKSEDGYYQDFRKGDSDGDAYLIGIDENTRLGEFDRCVFNIMTSPITYKTEIALSEGNPFLFTLNKDIPKVRLIYPHPPIEGEIFITFNVETLSRLKVQPYFGSVQQPEKKFQSTKTLIIKESELKASCEEEFCKIILEISTEDESVLEGKDDVTFETIIKSRAYVPSPLIRGVVREDVLVPGRYQYFTLDLQPKETGDVVVNFNRGSGKVIGRVISSEETDEDPDWNGKIRLPKIGDTNLLEGYDPFTRTLTITVDDTKRCADNNKHCELYIGVYSDDSYKTGVYEGIVFTNTFNIYYRRTDKKSTEPDSLNDVVNIPMNEYITDSITKIEIFEEIMTYFTFNIPVACKGFKIEMQCEACNVYLTKESKKPGPKEHEWAFESMKRMFKVYDVEPLNSETEFPKDQVFMMAIKATSVVSVYTTAFQFRVLLPELNKNFLVPVNGEQGSLCNITEFSEEKKGGFCDYVIPLFEYDGVSNLLVYAYGEEGTNVTLYYDSFSREKFEAFTPEELVEKLPRSSEKSTENKFEKDFIDFMGVTEVVPDTYFLVSVKASQKTLVTLMNSYRTFQIAGSANPSSVQVYNVLRDNELKLSMPDQYDYMLRIVSLSGKGTVKFGEAEKSFKIRGSRDSLSISVSKENSALSVSTMESSFKFYTWYTIRTEKNIDEVEYGQTGELYYRNIFFPINVFTRIDTEEDAICNFNIYRINDKDNEKVIDLDLTIKAVVTGLDEVYKIMSNQTQEIQKGDEIEGEYDKILQRGKVIIPKRLISESIFSDKVFYIKIEPKVKNETKFFVHAEIEIMPFNRKNTLLPIDQSFHGEILSTSPFNIYKLRPSLESDKYMKVSFATNNPKVTYAILEKEPADPTAQEAKKNSTSLNITELDKIYGEGSILISGEAKKEYYINIFTTEKLADNEKGNFAIRYETSESKIDKIQFNNELIWSFDEKELKVVFSQITLKGENIGAIYYLKMYEVEKPEEIYNTNAFISKQPKIQESLISYAASGSSIVMNTTKAKKKTTYYATVAAKTEAGEVFSYRLIKINSEKPQIIELEVSKEEQDGSYNSEQEYRFVFNVKDKDNYMKIETVSTDLSNPAFIYASDNATYPKRTDFKFLSYNTYSKQNRIFFPTNQLEADKVYVTINCPQICSFSLKYQMMERVQLHRDEEFSFVAQEKYLTWKAELLRNKNESDFINIYVIGGEEDDVKMEITLNDGTKIDFPDGKLLNGDIAQIKDSEYPDHKKTFYIDFEAKPNTYVRLGARTKNEYIKGIRPNSPAIYSLVVADPVRGGGSECFSADIDSEDKNDYGINIVTGTGNGVLKIATHDQAGAQVFYSEEFDTQIFYKFTYEVRKKAHYICVSPSSGNVIAFSLQVTSLSGITEATNIITPLVNGIEYEYQLGDNQLQYYRHYKHSLETKTTNFNVRRIEGDIRVYVVKCTTYPDCVYTPDNIKSQESYTNITDMHNLFNYEVNGDGETNLQDDEQILLLTHCVSKSCKYGVSFFDENDKFRLKDGIYYPQFMKERERDQYAIIIRKEKCTKIIVELNTFVGDSKLETITPDGSKFDKTERFAGNKNIVIISKKDEYLAGTYEFLVEAHSSNFYSIFYTYEIEGVAPEYSDPGSGASLLQIITLDETKSFNVVNNYKDKKTPFVTYIYPIGCDMEVSFVEGTTTTSISPRSTGYYQDTITSSEEKYKLDKYRYTIKPKNIKNEEEFCLFYFAALPIYQDQEILINEGQPFNFILDDKVSTLKLIYPFATNDPKHKNLFINFVLETEGRIKLTALVNGETSSEYLFTRSFIMSLDNLDVKCKGEDKVCPITIIVEKDDTEGIKLSELSFSITLKGIEPVPTMIGKNKVIHDVLLVGTTQYYMTDVEPGESGEVVLNFDNGSGEIFARLVEKGTPEKGADWNGRIVLPKKGMRDLLDTYDPYTKTLAYSSETQDGCKEKCVLVMAVVSLNEYQDDYIEANKITNEYSIFIRPFFKDVKTAPTIDLILNEYIVDYIEKSSTFRYYSFDLTTEVSEVILELQCTICILTVYQGTRDAYKNKWEFESKGYGKSFSIDGGKISGTSTKGQKFLVEISVDGVNEVFSSSYQFRVTPISVKSPKLISIDPGQNTICEIKTSNGYCDFLLPIFDYEMARDINAYALSTFGVELTIYANFEDMIEFDKFNKEKIENALAREGNARVSTEKDFLKEFAQLTFSNMTYNSYYILIGVRASKPTMITFLTTYFSKLVGTLPNPAKIELYQLQPTKSLKVKLPINRDYHLHIISVEGAGTMEIGGEKYELRGARDSFSTSLLKDVTELTATAIGENGLKFYSWLSLKNLTMNFDELQYGQSGEILYRKGGFPILYYARIEDEEKDSIVTVNFKDFKKTIEDDTIVDEFYISGKIVTAFQLATVKNGMMKTNINGTYDSSLQIGKIKFTTDDYKKQQQLPKYVFVNITTVKKEDAQNYSVVHTETSFLPAETKDAPLPISQYFFSEIKSNQNNAIYRLKKNFKEDNKMRILFSTGSNSLDFAMFVDTSEDQNQNSTKLNIVKASSEFGKVSVDISFDESSVNEIFFNIFKKGKNKKMMGKAKKEEEPISFALKYQTTSKVLPAEYTLSNSAINHTNSDVSLNVTFKAITNKVTKNIVPATYIVRTFEGSSQKIMNFAIDGRTQYYVTKIKGKEEENITMTISGDFKKKTYTVSIIGITEDEEILAYDLFYINLKSDVGLIILIVLIVFVLIGVIVVSIMLLAKRKKETLKDDVIHTSFANESKEKMIGINDNENKEANVLIPE